ncbi:MAG: hypothetical protein U1F40_02360 [Turneriella sp.]
MIKDPRLMLGLLFLLPLAFSACRKGKLVETAKANAKQYGLARCECDKLQRKDPPGDITLCFDQMQQAKRYLSFNIEMGKFSAAEKAEVMAHGDKVYQDCMAQQTSPR